ncbi:hypothetical protein LZ496_01760 [Sphingomonas sp. NSE70-1]|uniref:Uncharacterized protein n=1 Tax=Sphingomonas caseinilyticus TaxID=2908205 RepID=A0ABT0RR72_9SPHN|nr:hypothetical protein [Sphingomonas caseinilyticus]MCL6697513.1 hypothetical protein [Sphingomonas caseinilyticus]
MLSRIFWIGLAGIALIGGMFLQSNGGIFDWGDHREISAKVDESIEDRVDRAIDRSFDKMTVTRIGGEEVDVPAETKRAMAAAVGELVKAETDLAMVKVGDGSDEELKAARARSAKARAEVDRLEAEIKKIERMTTSDRDALREQIKREVREDVREAVRS